jgi:tetratricopeptide (TPR) repeat protein
VRRTSWVWAVALVAVAACGGEEGDRVELGEQQQEARANARESWSPELTARVDSANAAYAAGDYETAREIYTAITEEDPELGVAWFGLSMAERALGNEEAAQAALAEAEARNPGLGRMHDAATDPDARVPLRMEGHPEMPAGHPTVDTAPDGADMP